MGNVVDFRKCESLGKDQELTDAEREQLEELLRMATARPGEG